MTMHSVGVSSKRSLGSILLEDRWVFAIDRAPVRRGSVRRLVSDHLHSGTIFHSRTSVLLFDLAAREEEDEDEDDEEEDGEDGEDGEGGQ